MSENYYNRIPKNGQLLVNMVCECLLTSNQNFIKLNSIYNIQEIRICLKKKDADWWPRLLYEQKKLAWLKIDFEKWKTNDTDDSENDEASKLLQG